MSKTNKAVVGLTLGALGVVFGDIGTSPLYALRVIFNSLGQHLAITQTNVHGIISLVFWLVTIVVSVKYIGFIMRADNKGEGGIMALVSLIKSGPLEHHRKWVYIGLGLIGVALFYGDSAVTPAISVLSAVEGLKVVEPGLSFFVVPVTLAVLASLFWVQKYGSNLIGRLFGPVMLLWFLAIGVGGCWQVWQHPEILHALSPMAAVHFVSAAPGPAFVAMGAVVLAITGAEALYADMGHFGRAPIARAWFLFVFPALTLCYMGQGALLLARPGANDNPFFHIFPAVARIPMVILATAATFIASQAVISGAFSLTRQAIHLGFLPQMRVLHTSAKRIGQIYMPFINFSLFIIVSLLIIFFGTSEKLANAYGVAVSGTLAADTILFLVVMRSLWRRPTPLVALIGAVFLTIDLTLVSSNVSKIAHGGWVPLAIAVIVLLLTDTWQKGQAVTTRERRNLEIPLADFVQRLRSHPVPRVPGQAVYIGRHFGQTPLALLATLDELHELHEKVVIVYVHVSTTAHIPESKRAMFDDLGYKSDGISRLNLTYGFHDTLSIPKELKSLRHLSQELDFNAEQASYFISQTTIVPTSRHNLARWRKSLYILMARNALSSSDYYHLPVERTVEMRTLLEI